MISSAKFDENYYENGRQTKISLYENYRWMPTRSIQEANAVSKQFPSGSILDYGCAKGFLVRALRLLGREAFGEDISDYAITNSHPKVKRYVGKVTTKKYDCIVSKDVLEHVSEREIPGILSLLKDRAKNFLFVVPLGEDGYYRIPDYELDKTHIIRQDEEWWLEMFHKCGFKVVDFSYSIPGLKDHWVEKYPTGNGFFILTK